MMWWRVKHRLGDELLVIFAQVDTTIVTERIQRLSILLTRLLMCALVEERLKPRVLLPILHTTDDFSNIIFELGRMLSI